MSDTRPAPKASSEIKDDDKTVIKFLEHVVRGEQAEAAKMLKADPSLAYKKAKITDYSGRQFIGIGNKEDGISGFQYALWALDTDMWQMMDPEKNDPQKAQKQLLEVEDKDQGGLTYIPPEPVSDEEKARIKKEEDDERKKIKEMMKTEKKDHPFFDHANLPDLVLSYHSKYNLKTEHHYDFELIKALESYNNYLTQKVVERAKTYTGLTLTEDNWIYFLEKEDWPMADTIYKRVVGGAQRLVPVHIANQYCRTDSSFDPTQFDAKESLTEHRTLQFYKDVQWFPLDREPKVRLGIDFAVVKSRQAVGSNWLLSQGIAGNARKALAAMIALNKARHQDLKILTQKLDAILKKNARPS